MTLWNSFKKWAFRDDTTIDADESTVVKHTVVGEPVISFIESLHREKSRRYSFSRINREQYGGELYHWMSGDGFFQLIDLKTARRYQMYIHDKKLYDVAGLPFELNYWEKSALFEAWLNYRVEARQRRARIKSSRIRRERESVAAQEKIDREEFAKQFRENAV